jgi:hypothetical protein
MSKSISFERARFRQTSVRWRFFCFSFSKEEEEIIGPANPFGTIAEFSLKEISRSI